MNPTDINRILEEYQEKLALYNDFCLTMNNLLIYLLMDKAYKYQISSRLKSIDSLKRKLIKKNGEGKKYKKLSDIEDVAGIRIIFYLESDKQRFISDFLGIYPPKFTVERNSQEKRIPGDPCEGLIRQKKIDFK